MIKELIISKIREKALIDKEKHPVKRAFSPTDTGKCPRELYYEFINAEKADYNDKDLTTFAIGKITHEYLQGLLSEGIHEFRIDSYWRGLHITGYVDTLINTDEGLVVVDYKTNKPEGMKWIEEGPKDEHIKQVVMYLELLGLSKGFLIYWNKSTGEMVEHEVKRDKKVINQIFKLFSQVAEALAENKVPEAVNDWRCDYCKFKGECKGNKENK